MLLKDSSFDTNKGVEDGPQLLCDIISTDLKH